jgi:hypothetical protein
LFLNVLVQCSLQCFCVNNGALQPPYPHTLEEEAMIWAMRGSSGELVLCDPNDSYHEVAETLDYCAM